MASANDIKMRILAEDKTAAAFRSAKKNIDATEKSMRLLKAAISIGAVTAFVTMAKRTAETADQIAKFSQRIGVNAEALQELQFAATQSGIKVEAFNMGMQRFTRRAAEAAQGMGEAKAALRDLGIQLNDANGNLRPAEQLLGDVAEAFKGIEDPAERVRLAFKLFDSEGVAMLQMLGDGRAAMMAMRQEARDLGIVMSEDTLKSAEQVANQFDIMSRVIDANLTQAMVNIAPVLTAFTNGLRILTKELKEFFDRYSDISDMSLKSVVNEINRLVKKREELKKLAKYIEDFGGSSAGVTNQIKKINEQIGELQERSKQLTIQGQTLGDVLIPEVETQATIEKLTSSFDQMSSGFKKGVTDYANSVESLALETQKATSKMFSRMEDSIVNFAMTGKFAFREFANSVVADIIRIQTRQALAQAIGSSGNIFSAIGNFFGGFFANGGRPPSNKVSVVGEKGPELFVPDSAGTVIPNGGMAMSGGGQPVHVTFNIQSWDSRDTTQAIQQSAPQIVGIIQNAFNKRGRKGPMG